MKTALRKIAKSNRQKQTVLACLLCIIGLLLGNFSEWYRLSDLRPLYYLLLIGSYVLVVLAVIWSGVNAVALLKTRYHSWKKKILWVLISLFPVLLIIIIMFVTFLQEYNATYLELDTMPE